MKNNFQSKAVPRGTRTIWRYLGALFLLFTFAIGQMWGTTYTYDFGTASDFPQLATTATSGKITMAQRSYTLAASESGAPSRTFVIAISSVANNKSRKVTYKDASNGLNFERCGALAFSLDEPSIVTILVKSKDCQFGIDPYYGTTYTNDTYGDFGSNSTTTLTKGTEITINCDAGNYKICCPGATGGSYNIKSIKITPAAKVTFDGNGATSGTMEAAYLEKGVAANLPANAFVNTGKDFAGWKDASDNTYTDAQTVTLSANLALTAQWVTAAVKYTITEGTPSHGAVAANKTEAAEGATVTITATPDFRYLFGSWKVYKTSDESTEVAVTETAGVYTFEMPAYDVTVNATFAADTRKQILYLTTASTANDKMYAALSAIGDYNVIVEAPEAQTLANYDLVVLHESIAGNAADPTKGDKKQVILNIPTTTIPVLNTKSYFYTSARWNWGAAANGKKTKGMHVNTAYCNIASHPLFNDLTPDENDSIIILSSINGDNKPMQPVTSFISGKEGYTLANVPDGCAIHELTPAQRGVASGKYLLISVYNKDLDNLNANGQKLFQNAAAYLIGSTTWTPATAPSGASVTASPSAVYEVGDEISLSASATGTDASTTYTWYKGATLDEAKTAGAIKATATAAAGGDAYSKADCVAEDAGLYWCVISNGGACEASASLAVTVSSTPIISYDITFVSDHGTAPTATTGASIALTEITGVTGWQHTGWTANVNVEVDAEPVTAGTLIANGKTAILASDVTFTAVWKQIITVTYNANGGTCGTASATYSAGDPALVLPNATAANLVFDGWFTAATGGTLVGRAGDEYTPTGDIEIFAHYGAKLYQAIFSNSFDAFIDQANKTVTVYYLEGESAPTLASVKAMKADGTEVAAGTFVDNGSAIDVTIDEKTATYTVTKTAVAPYTYVNGDPITFDGTETYIKTGNAFSTASGKEGWKFSKNDNDWSRELPGNNRIYFFIGAAESITLTSGCSSARAIKVYRNGTQIFDNTMPKNSASPNYVTLTGSNAPAMYAVVSNQTDGDGAIKIMTLAPWVPTTGVALQEGDDPISAKEIWASTNFTLTAVVTPDNASDKTITWTSSNEAVATVVGGVVTGVAANASPVTITATTVDGISATCAVTVTAAPEPSAAPVITAQPASTNYYEGATIAALEVVATGESLSYQWYLGADAIDGAIAATYQPTVSAIGTYVYHCVVTNTEAGKLPTSLASDNATITIAEDPSAIKLINKSTGAINTTNFITGVTANDNVHGENGAVFGSSSSNASVKGLSGLNKVVVYNATTTQTKIKLVLYNTNSAAQEVVLSTMAEGDVDPVGQAISVPSKELYSTGYITYNSTKNRTFYLHTKSTNVQISQIQVIESGEELAVAGKKDYSLNLNKGRVYAYASSAQTWEGLSMNLGSNYSPATTEYITFKDNALSFSVPNDVCLTITPARAGDKYYVTDVADGTDNATTTVAGTPNSFDLTGGVGKVWYIRSQGSNVQLTNIAFSAPRCAEPAFNALTNSDICSGDPYVALDGTATVADLGTPTYKWYAEGADESDPAAILGTDATYTPTADGKYYVIATNHKEGFADNEKKSDLVTVTTYASAEITTAPADVRQTVGENATLTVVATGKAPLSYQWYTCDENGDNAVLIAGAEEDTYTVNVTADFDQFYKVVVTSGCGEASAVAHVVEWRALPQLKVNASTTWDWVNAGENIKLTGSTAPKKNEECVMANVKVGSKMPTNDDTFNSQALLFYGENVRAVDGGRAYASVGYIKFTTTVAGKVTVEFSTNTDDKVRCVKINGVASETSDKKATVKTFSTVVPAGEVSLVGYEEETANAYIRISKIIFDATDVSDADYTRDVTEGRYGTICLPNGGVMVGAEIFTLAYYGATSQKFFFDEIASAEMEAGKPYLFFPHEGATQLGVYYTDSENKSGLTVNGFVGFIGADADAYTQVPANDNCYIISNNLYRQVQTGAEAYILSNRAYIDMTKVTNVEPAKAPGARRIGLGVQGKDQAQGFENIETGDAPMKVMINGTMYILRGEKVYDATGRLVK